MNNGTTQYTASFHYKILDQSRYVVTCFFVVKIYTFQLSFFIIYETKINTREKRNEQINIKKSYMRILTQDLKV